MKASPPVGLVRGNLQRPGIILKVFFKNPLTFGVHRDMICVHRTKGARNHESIVTSSRCYLLCPSAAVRHCQRGPEARRRTRTRRRKARRRAGQSGAGTRRRRGGRKAQGRTSRSKSRAGCRKAAPPAGAGTQAGRKAGSRPPTCRVQGTRPASAKGIDCFGAWRGRRSARRPAGRKKPPIPRTISRKRPPMR